MFNKNDKVMIKQTSSSFAGREGIVLDSNDKEVKVQLNLGENMEDNKLVINIFKNEEVELNSFDNLLNEEIFFENNNVEEEVEVIMNENKQEVLNGIKMTETQLKHWCSDNDANYYTQDIDSEGNVIIRSLNEDIATYNFNTKLLTLIEKMSEIIPTEQFKEEEHDDFYEYTHDLNINDKEDVYPSWEFAGKIAAAEGMNEWDVYEYAREHGYKIFQIEALNYCKSVIADKKIKAEDIMDEFACYLEGRPKVTEWK